MEDHFFVILERGDLRLKRHSESDTATEEAKRLARENPQKTFFILRAERCARVRQPEPPVVVEATNDDPIPF